MLDMDRGKRELSNGRLGSEMEISVAIQPPILPVRLLNFRSYLEGRRCLEDNDAIYG